MPCPLLHRSFPSSHTLWRTTIYLLTDRFTVLRIGLPSNTADAISLPPLARTIVKFRPKVCVLTNNDAHRHSLTRICMDIIGWPHASTTNHRPNTENRKPKTAYHHQAEPHLIPIPRPRPDHSPSHLAHK